MKTSFNAGWSFRPKQSLFLELTHGAAAESVQVTLPHDAMIGSARDATHSHMNAYFPGGMWEYRKVFTAPDEWRDRRVRLQFEGVYRDAMVYVNHDFAGGEPNGYSEFVVDLDPYLRYGEENTIVVECRAHDDARWYSGAGIYRPVHLVVQDRVHMALDGVSVTTPEIDGDGALVMVAAEIENDTPHTVTVRAAFELRTATGDVVARGAAPCTLRPNTTAVARQRLYVERAQRWSPEHPALYTCTTVLTLGDREVDAQTTTFGVRSLQLDPQHGLRLNGVRIDLRGACVHHDNGPIGAATIARAEERRIELLKAAGFNAVRSAHNPMSRAMLDACDRHGMVVMDETWDIWTEPKRDHDHALRFVDRWRTDVAAVVRKDRNHPSVVMYSTGNEIPEVGSPLGAARAREIAEEIRALDPTRYVTNAVQPVLAVRDFIGMIRAFLANGGAMPAADEPEPAETGQEPQGVNSQMAMWAKLKDAAMSTSEIGEMMEEVCASLDVAGYNYLEKRYPIDAVDAPNRVIVGAETYITALAAAWPMIVDGTHVVGDFTWTGWDYLGEAGIGRAEYADPQEPEPPAAAGVVAAYPWRAASTGDIDILGNRRTGSYFREIVFGLRPEPFIAVTRPEAVDRSVRYSGPWTWSDTIDSWTWPGCEGVMLPIEVYSDADEVELLLNGTSLGRRAAGRAVRWMARFTVPYESGELTAVAYRAGAPAERHVLRTATGAPRLTLEPDRFTFTATEEDLVHLAISIEGDDRIVLPRADRTVTVELDGPGVLQGLASANPASEEPFTGTACTTYEGRALAVIRPVGEGAIVVRVAAEGLASATCLLTSAHEH